MTPPFKAQNPGEDGAMLLTLIIVIMVMGILTAAILPLTATHRVQASLTHLSLKAYYLGESGYRYLAARYKALENKETAAEANFFTTVNGMVREVPHAQGSFQTRVFPYWFTISGENGKLKIKLPGSSPKNFDMPPTGEIKVGGQIIPYHNGHFSPATGEFTLSPNIPGLNMDQWEGQALYPVLSIHKKQGKNLILTCPTPGILPPLNGQVLVNGAPYRYQAAKIGPQTGQVTLENLSPPIAATPGQKLVPQKMLCLKSTGRVGDHGMGTRRTITYYIPLAQEEASLASTEITMEKAKDFKQYFTPLDAHGSVGQYQGSGGQTISGVAMENLEQKREAGAHRDHHQGSFLFKQTDLIQKTWKKSHRLDYDVQVKVASNNALLYGAMGIDIRKQKKGEGLYQGFGISFVKFHESPLPGHGSAVKIHFNHGVAPFHPGQRIDYYHFPGWDDWNFIANGRILKAHNENVPGHNYHFKGWITLDPKSIWPTHAFDNFHAGPDDYIHLESGFYGAEVTGVNPPQTALDDFIPDGIKPPNMGSALLVNPHIQFPHWDQDNETEVVLLVLWQQKVVGHKEKRRWLAYKDLTHDIHLKGKQDYMDGRIVNDGATLLVRVREKMKSNQKINEIQVFYADASRVHPWQERTKTPRAHDIGQNRMAYRPGFSRPDQPRPPEGWAPLWPPKNMETWAADYNRLDYFSHIERPHGENSPEAFQWDGLADTSGEIDSWENAGKALFQLTSHGKILISDFTTPEGGNYAQPEIALTGFFDSATQWPGQEYNQPLIVFTDFSIRFFGPKKGARGFMTAIQK